MSDENERHEQDDQPTEPKLPIQKPDTSHDEDEIQTISLLDLMAEMNADEPPQSAPASDDEQPTQTLFPPQSALASDDQPTLTEAPAPQQPATRQPVPLPLTPEEMTPQERPFETDIEATTVSPRVAIPGSRTPDDEAPTQLYQPVPRPVSEDNKPTQVGSPVREQTPPPVRRQERPSSPPPAAPKVAVASQTKAPKPKRRRDYRG